MNRLFFFFALFSLLAACKPAPAPETPPRSEPIVGEGSEEEATQAEAPGCAKTGCSSQVCAEAGTDLMTTCEFRAEYACYREARCERQPGGECGFTPTPELTACLASPPALD